MNQKPLTKQDTLASVTSTAIYLLYCPQFKELSISREFKKDDASRHRVLDILGSVAKESALESLHFRCYDEVGWQELKNTQLFYRAQLNCHSHVW